MTTNKSSPIITKDILKTIFDNISENELFVCSICATMCTNQNKHQLVSTKCGHLFGKNCIRKRLKETKQCPVCFKLLETRREQQLRSMCLSSVVTIFPFEISKMRDERRQLRMKLNRIKTRLQRVKTKLNTNKNYLKKMNKKILKHSKYNKLNFHV
jgi:septal ring factor EnvC (AmiA/AmiB activator)